MKNADQISALVDGLPESEIFIQGVQDLANKVVSVPGLLVVTGAPRLRECLPNLTIGPCPERPERRLYALLGDQYPDEAYSQYNAYLRKLNSFCQALVMRIRKFNR